MAQSSLDSRTLVGAGLILICAIFAPQRAMASLYQDLGATAGLVRIVDQLVENLINDPRIKAHFRNTDLTRLRAQFNDQLCMLSDGPCRYAGRSMLQAHKGQYIDIAAFNAVIEDLQSAMDHEDIPVGVQNRLLAKLAPMYREIVSQGNLPK